MISMVYFLVFALGAVIGSFLNVIILRYNTGRSVGGRSACMSCGHKLSFSELVPILSFLLQRGRCLKCGARISWQYPAVEAVTGLAFMAVVYRELSVLPADVILNFQFSIFNFQFFSHLLSTFYFLLTFSLLIAITSYDIRHKIIPNGLVWTFIVVSLIKLFSLGYLPPLHEFLAGPVLAAPFVLIWFFSGGRAMGFGDSKLALGVGWMLGLAEGISALLLSFWIGGIIGLFLLASRGKQYSLKSELPFAPFLAIAAFLVYMFQFDFLRLSSLLG